MAPPQPPRRYSNPEIAPAVATTKNRRHSDFKPDTNSLRHELLSLDLNKQEVKNWLGSEGKILEETESESESTDVPLQRSLSLDGGIEVIKYLQNIASLLSADSLDSAWTVDSDDNSLVYSHSASMEDIPTSPIRMRSRRPSLDSDRVFLVRNTVVENADKGQDTVKTPSNNLGSSVHGVEKSKENLNRGDGSRKLFYRDIILVPYKTLEYTQQPSSIAVRRPRLSRHLSYQESMKTELNLRNEILMKETYDHHSCESLQLLSNAKPTRRSSLESKPAPNIGFKLLIDSYKGVDFDSGNVSPNILRLKRNFSFRDSAEFKERIVPTLNATYTNVRPEERNYIAKIEDEFSDASIELVSSDCDCQICVGAGDDKPIFSSISSVFGILLTKVSRRKFFWDENNNLSQGEMYNSIIHILKLMFGLWLRHLDHNTK